MLALHAEYGVAEEITSADVPVSLSTPRQTMRTFIESMAAVSKGNKSEIERAISTLDLADVNPLIHDSRGKELAQTLSSVIERSKKVVLRSIPEHPKGDRYIFGRYSQGVVEIVKQDDGRWLFSRNTVSNLPAILVGLLEKPAKFGAKDPQVSPPFYIGFRAKLPTLLKGKFLLEYWQWLGIFLVILVGAVSDKLVTLLLAKNVKKWKKLSQFNVIDNDVLRPVSLIVMALIWWFGLGLLGLPDTALIILSVTVKLFICLSVVWAAFRLVDIINELLVVKAKETENQFDDLLVPMLTRSLKIFIVVIGVLFSANNLNIDITSLLAGLGIGGLAFALAARDLLGNFFGSLTVLIDRPFQIGDWVVIDDIEGSIEQVGFRSTRIRTFYNSLITLPNSLLTTNKIDNMGARQYRRMKTILGLTYDTPPDQIDAFCEGVRALVRLHPYMRKDYYHVYFNGYNAASLDILVYVFWQTPNWHTELRERHRFLLDILRLAKQLGIEFAYPTQTLYVKQDAGDANADYQPFHPAMSQADAFAKGQKEAEAIVNNTLGKNVKPDPVSFS